MAPSQPKQYKVESLIIHCDLAAAAHMVGNVRNWLLRTMPTEGRCGEVV